MFVSDRNHGNLEGVKTVFPDCNHGYCYKHLTANLKDKFRGVPKLVCAKVVRQFADCVYASTKDEFNRCYAKLIATGGQRCSSFIADLLPEKWSHAYFEGQRYGQMTSNECESWNARIRLTSGFSAHIQVNASSLVKQYAHKQT